MSTLKVDNIRHNSATSDAITMASDGTCSAKLSSVNDGQFSHRNMIINGGMMISQRGSSVAITGGSNTVPLIDRYMAVANSGMTYNVTISQEADNPFGLGKSFKSLTTSAKTPSGSENYIIRTKLEEQDITRIGFGTSGCKKTTLTFWVKSNKTGTYSVMVAINSFDINLLTSYTINAQNTWEKKTISIPEYTTSYTHPADNGSGFTVDWHLSSGPDDLVSAHSWQTSASNARAVTGQVNLLDTVGNYWQLANVQYEVGEVSTPFEHRSFADELRRCQRYYYQVGGQTNDGSPDNSYGVILPMAMCASATRVKGILHHPVNMRTGPTLSGGGSGTCAIQQGDNTPNSTLVYQNGWSGSNTTRYSWVDLSPNSGTVSNVGETGIVYAYNSTYHIKVSAEFTF